MANHFPQVKERDLSWIGQSREEDGKIFYRAVRVGEDEELRIGDCVFVQNTCRFEDDYVGCIVQLYDDVHCGDQVAIVHWFYRATDVLRLASKGKGEAQKALRFELSKKRVDRKELFLGAVNDIGKCDLGTLGDKCSVRIFRRGNAVPGDDCGDFFVREVFNSRTRRFEIVTDALLRNACFCCEERVSGADLDVTSDGKRTRRSRASTLRSKDLQAFAKSARTRAAQTKSSRKRRASGVVDNDSDSDWMPSGDEDARAAKQQIRDSTPHPRSKRASTFSVGAMKRPRKQSVAKRKSIEGLKGSQLPVRLAPAEVPSSPLDEACSRLHCSAVPPSLPCRDKQFDEILTFIESKLLDDTGGCMYISGVPGTGKTATVREVTSLLQKLGEDGDVPDFTFVEINGMRLSEPRQAYVQLWRELSGSKKRVTTEHAADLLDKFFNSPSPGRRPIVLLADELDLLWTSRQTVLYDLFDWPMRRNARLIVLAVANTMDLPERIMMGRVSSRVGMQRITFPPYSYKQLEQIVLSRIESLAVFDKEAIELAARKVAVVSGDARRALAVCLRAVEGAQRKLADSGNKMVSIRMSDIDVAIAAMFQPPKIKAIRNASFYEREFLRAIISSFQRSGVEETTFGEVYSVLTITCRTQAIKCISMSTAQAVCARLAACRLLLLDQSTTDLQQRISLNASVEDVTFALR